VLVIPVALKGCRFALRHDQRWFPRRLPLSVDIGRLIYQTGTDFETTLSIGGGRARKSSSIVASPISRLK